MEDTPLPALAEARRRLCGELLAAAAVHSAISDELVELEHLEASRPLTAQELERQAVLRTRKREALRRHDVIDHRLRRLLAYLKSTNLGPRRPLSR